MTADPASHPTHAEANSESSAIPPRASTSDDSPAGISDNPIAPAPPPNRQTDGRTVQFEYCISLGIVTLQCQSEPIHLAPGERAFWRSLPYQFVNGLLGWWGVPWGPLLTLRAMACNLFGGIRLAGLILLALLLCPTTGHAGIYAPDLTPLFEPGSTGTMTPLPFDAFRRELADRMLLGAPPAEGTPDIPARQELLNRTQPLLGKPTADLTIAEMETLSANLLRLRKLDVAFPLLRQFSRDRRANFALLANLAALHQLREEYPAAVAAQEIARSEFPDELPGFTPEQRTWYKRLEREYVLRLLRLRRSEPPRVGPAETWDDLFAGVTFLDDAGQYTPGQLAASDREKLPADAIAIVQQLLLWSPEDSRLYWLLAELYAANNELQAASRILDECVDSRRFQNSTLIDHRHRIREAIQARIPPDESFLPSRERTLIVGMIGGSIMLVLLVLQIRVTLRRLRKRRQS
ncbi:tetratricopeptide repeat protein [Tuwongella immobilis]|uniref:Uncharacterized protein n=1 Tax=Tuwongella immobilis TaxID=692036 RepID=A0A6C2YHK6_9BACT|nr:tetratricopeptide repeat protein [Tuwongella immobilis]VIP01008.1 hypothetical protein : Uncharacterized protein OS=Sorangium cellulosum (strain So ce56) GN=sce4503 PE=4 SV=1: TPR_19 [Tuwongella immobilis]VTR97440.1 hypothetical protein : Uncharacterized protein OS=Sorangium cellulosum (strain So ce56) GN=sce4503 PE=4 SV=1: TPR_19 [Tuwongella immobilis]